MLENALFTRVRATLLTGLAIRIPAETVEVVQLENPVTVGAIQGPAIFLQDIGNVRYGHLLREEIPVTTDPDAPYFVHRETQWWETTFQIGAMARRNPMHPNFLTLHSAMDIAKIASDILQGDAGLAALAVDRIRPLRITQVRNVPFVNESDQFEKNPSFDITLIYPEIVESTTPAATVEGVVLNIGDSRI